MDIATIISLVTAGIAILGVRGSFISIAVKAGRYSEKFDNIEKDRNELKSITADLKERLIRVEDILMLKHKGASDFFAAKHSPRVLNDLGEKIYEDMKGESFLVKNKELLYSKIKETEPKTAYDVENASENAIVSFLNDDLFNEIKVFVYNYPAVKKENGDEIEVSLGDAVGILALPLRDMYLNDNPDILR